MADAEGSERGFAPRISHTPKQREKITKAYLLSADAALSSRGLNSRHLALHGFLDLSSPSGLIRRFRASELVFLYVPVGIVASVAWLI